VHDRNDDDLVGSYEIEHAKGKSAQEGASDILADAAVAGRVQDDGIERLAELVEEIVS